VAAISTCQDHHALLVSIDRLHAQDLERFIVMRPQSTLWPRSSAHGMTVAQLLATLLRVWILINPGFGFDTVFARAPHALIAPPA
jgi:hypothetical protein